MHERVARAIAAELVAYPAIAAAWVFGSTARGDADEDSDLDLAVLLRPEAAGGARPLLQELASALERCSPSGQVDILVLGEQGPVLRHRILAEGKLIHDADPNARVDFEGRTIAEYLDWKPTHDIAMRSAFTGIRDRLHRGAE